MVEQVIGKKNVLPIEISSAILSSRLFVGTIKHDCLLLSDSANFQLRKALFEDYLDLKIESKVYFRMVDEFLLVSYSKQEGGLTHSISFKELMVRLFVAQYQKEIGIRRSLIIANNSLDDKTEEFIEWTGISEARYLKFMQGYSELDRILTLSKICEFYGLSDNKEQQYSRIELEEEY
jgi:hypothetical protein